MITINNFQNVLSEKTSALHKVAEHSGFNEVLFGGKATREMYGKYLLHKYHIYSELESAMSRFAKDELLSSFIFPELTRKELLVNDLDQFLGDNWKEEDRLSTVSSYVYRIREIAKEKPELLIAHAYVHYFADLSGGLIIKKILKEQYKYSDKELNAYRFDQVEDVNKLKKNYRSLINYMVEELHIEEAFIEETKLAYIYSISALVELVS